MPDQAGELAAIERLASALPPPPPGEVWIGDDAAVLDVTGEPVLSQPSGRLLYATDLVVDGVHFDRSLTSLQDVGWKVLAANVSDMAAMGGRPWRCVAAIAGASAADLDAVSQGLADAARCFGCPLVGGDVSAGGQLVVTIAILGVARDPVLRSGGRAGDLVYVTGPLGAAAAGLRQLRLDPRASGEAVDAHRRPMARVEEGVAAATAGATAMIDVSDGFGLDLHRLACASGVGLELDSVPVAQGATEEEALGGGEDYELVFSASEGAGVAGVFAAAGLRSPILVGRLSGDPSRRLLAGRSFDPSGWEHHLG